MFEYDFDRESFVDLDFRQRQNSPLCVYKGLNCWLNAQWVIRNVLEERNNVTFVEQTQSDKNKMAAPMNCATQLKILTNTSTLSTDESITDV